MKGSYADQTGAARLLLNGEQEALKSRLAEKIAEPTAKLEEVSKSSAEVKKLVKLDLSKESWKEFGITDTR